jgi:ABC-2 type transport system permease protein
MVFQRLARLCRRELTMLVREYRLLSIIILVPICYTMLFGMLYAPKRVTQIPTWVIDEDRSAFSRAIATATARDEMFHVVRVDGTLEEFRAATMRGDAYACTVIPYHFEHDLKLGKPVRLLTLMDGGNMIISNSVTRGAAEVAGTFNVGVQEQHLAMTGTPSMYALHAALPLETAARIWYNPTYNYMDFLMPGLIGTVIQQVTLLAVALAFARERELCLFGDVTRITHSPLEVLCAKGLVYTLINLLMAALAFVITVGGFGVPMTGSLPAFALLLTLFITALVAMGVIISVVAKDQLFATQILMLIAVPSFLVSGYTWPQMSMTRPILMLSNLLPLTHFVLPLRKLFMQHGTFADIQPHLYWLWCLTILCYGGAYLVLSRLMRQARHVVREPAHVLQDS